MLIHVSKKGLDCIKIGKAWSIRVICIGRFGNLSPRLGQGLSLIGNVVFPYSIHVIFELFEAFDLRATFMIW